MICADWIEHWAKLEPAREALVVPATGCRETYADLHRGSLRAVRWLRERGVASGDRVAVTARNRVAVIELFFACARLGAILVPVNWRLAAAEVAYVLSDCAPKVTLSEPEFAAAHGGHPGLVELGDAAPWDGAHPDPAFDPDALVAGTPAMILYTSGTTGRPKGAILTQGSIAANAVQTAMSWDLSGSDISLTHTPLFHTGGWNVLTLPLLRRGGKLVLTQAFDEDETLGLIAGEGLTLLFAVPTMFERMRRSPAFPETDFGPLRYAISGGAPCPPEIEAAFRERGVRFKQGYGLTEVGPNCFAVSLAEAEARPGTVGLPVSGCRVRLADDAGAPVAAGAVGEILLRGPHMCAGYWGKPEATDAAIRDGWFHTGDLGRHDEDGYLFIVGRKKEMFISGGENVYPAEVERVLREHPAVRSAAVVGVPHPEWGEVGCAFLVAEDAAADDGALKEFLREALARYKVPKRFVWVDELPLTASGKVARAALAARAAAEADA